MLTTKTRLSLAAIAVTAMLGAPVAPAAAKPRKTICTTAYGVRMAVVKKHGKRAPGRNICRWGIKTKRGSKRATTLQRAKYLRALRRLNTAPEGLSAGSPRVPPAGTATPRVRGGHLASIRACESGGNYSAVSPSGQYRGAYQFDHGTWASVGGSGDPAAASPAEQDKRAAILYEQRGAGPWPVCGR